MHHIDLSIIVTYKNRRHHIEQTLPTLLSQKTSKAYEVVIVDYNSSDDLSPFLVEHAFGSSLYHVRCLNIELFNLSHARNVGASHARGNVLYFVDVDTCLSKEAVDFVLDNLSAEKYLAAEDASVKKDIINGGLIATISAHHHAIYGFNEHLIGWGFEDIDYKIRLEHRLNLKHGYIPSNLYQCIDHGDDQRVQCYNESKEISWTKNRQIALRTWDDPCYGSCPNILLKRYGT